jgi:hypothetical protein
MTPDRPLRQKYIKIYEMWPRILKKGYYKYVIRGVRGAKNSV